ncbi:unnamed protein product [Linum tenue]|uniref:Secreted protein n=1 Tax=Linum tenue TaxID=586396 RepID=A0AAV0QFI5_9ROSI|nr:unnamed protein product [Linum tenue]
MIHGFSWALLVLGRGLLPSDEPGRVPHRRGPRRDVDQNHRPCPNFRSFSNVDIPQDRRPGAYQHAIADLRVPVAASFPRSTERDVVQDRHVVPNHRRLAHDHPRGVVEQNPLPDPRRRVNVDGENVGDPGLQR